MRRIAIGAGAALLVAGVGTWIAVHRHSVSDAWTSIRRHMPFGAPQVERSASVAPPTPPSRPAVREAIPAHATRRHAQLQTGTRKAGTQKAGTRKAGTRKANAAAKRSSAMASESREVP